MKGAFLHLRCRKAPFIEHYFSITRAVGPLDQVASSRERRPPVVRKFTTSGPPGCSTATDHPSAGVADSASTPAGRYRTTTSPPRRWKAWT